MLIKIGNSSIPVDPGISLPLVLRSPLFTTSESKIPGSYIFNSSFPATEALRHEFGQAHRVQRHGRATAELPYLISSGSLRYQGNCIVSQADAMQYDIAFKIDNGDLAGKLNGKTLKDLNLGADQIITSIYSTAHSETFNFPLFNFISANELRFAMFGKTDIDFTGSFNSGTEAGSIFTAPMDVSVSHTIISKCTINLGSVKIKIYKNNVVISTITMSVTGTYSNTFAYDLQAGDTIKVWMWICSTTASPFQADMVVSELNHQFFIATTIFDEAISKSQYESDFAIFPINNKSLLDNFPDDAFQLDNLSLKTLYSEYYTTLNYFLDGHFPMMLIGEKDDETIYAANLFTPFVYMRTLLCKIASEAGYSIINNPFDGEFNSAVLYNGFAENTYSGTTPSLVPVKPSFNLSDHVPEIAQNDFLKWISILTGYMPVIDNNAFTITFIDLKDKHITSTSNPEVTFPGIILPNPKVQVDPEYAGIKFELKRASNDNYLGRIKELSDKFTYIGEVDDPRDLPATGKVNDMYYVKLNNAYYVFQYNPETYTLTYYFYTEKFPLIYSEGLEPYLSITTELCPILTKRMLDESPCAPFARLWRIPRTEQPGTFEGFQDGFAAESGFQILYYKGMSLDSLGQPYPLGTCRHDDYSGNPLLFTDINAESLFAIRYKGFLQWLAYDSKPVTFKVILTAGQLRKLKFDQIYSGNGFMFLIKEIRINILCDGLSVAEMDVYTC
ncbi:MAG: hypothetical protein IPH88_12480 [Bacteroidales bacterium]|nr:hypothetical protein [Bacteroidales bacterium]